MPETVPVWLSTELCAALAALQCASEELAAAATKVAEAREHLLAIRNRLNIVCLEV